MMRIVSRNMPYSFKSVVLFFKDVSYLINKPKFQILFTNKILCFPILVEEKILLLQGASPAPSLPPLAKRPLPPPVG